MARTLFKGIQQVTIDKFNSYSNNEKKGYLWFVREPVSDDANSDNPLGNDKYYVYLGTRCYGSFWEGQIETLALSLEAVRTAVGLDENFNFKWEDVDSVVDAFNKVKEWYDALVAELAAVEADVEVAQKDIEELKSKAHIHDNKDVLDGIDETRVGKWDDTAERLDIFLSDNDLTENVVDTLKEIQEYINTDGKAAAEMVEKVETLAADVELKAYASDVYTKEESDERFVKTEGFNEFTVEMEAKLDGIEEGAQVNIVEKVKVNGVEATIADKVADVTIDADDVVLGVDVMNGDAVEYASTEKVTSVLQSIQNKIANAVSGAYRGVSAGNGVEVSELKDYQQTISLKVSKEEGNLVKVDENGIFAAMYYEGDDVEPFDYKEAIEKGGDVVLQDSVKMATAFVLENVNTVVDLNGKTVQGGVFAESNGSMVKGDSDSYAFWVKDGANLVLNGDGVVEAQAATYSMAVWVQGGTVTINGGTYVNAGEGSDLIYASNGGKVYIYGGEFKPCEKQEGVDGTQNKYSALNIKDRDRDICEIKVYGGKFYGFNPADNVSEGPNTNFVAEGYKSVEVETNVWEVIPE